MTRKKKNRKIGQIGIRKQDDRPERKPTSTRIKKAPKGQRSGTRNSLMEENQTSVTQVGAGKKDPKHGSKKKIELVVTKSKPEEKKPKPQVDKKPAVKLTKAVVNTITPEEEFDKLEQDEQLLDLAQRAEAGEMLQGKEAKYFNKHMARYEELCEILGIEEADEDDSLGGDQWDDLLKD